MLGTLLLPLLGSACVLLLAIATSCLRRAYVAAPGIWTLHIWMLLVLYPSLCRRTLAIFDCVTLRGHSYLRDDIAQECYTGTWAAWVAVACVGIVVYCVGLPAAAYAVARRRNGYAALSESRRKRAALLLASYTEVRIGGRAAVQ